MLPAFATAEAATGADGAGGTVTVFIMLRWLIHDFSVLTIASTL